MNQEKSFACAEIESARAVVLKLGEAFEEQERSSEASRAQGPVSSILRTLVSCFDCFLCIMFFLIKLRFHQTGC